MADTGLVGIAQQETPTVGMSSADTTAGANDLPMYSWGLDPATGQWGYFMNKAGSMSGQIGRKAGDKLASYAAPKNDAASMQQQALNHLLNTQLTANAPAAASPATPAQTNVTGSGIAAVGGGGGGGHSSAVDGVSGGGGIADVYGGLGNPSSPNWGATNNALDNAKTLVEAAAAKYNLSEATQNKLANFLGLDTGAQTQDKLADVDMTQGPAVGYSPAGGIDPATAAMAREAAAADAAAYTGNAGYTAPTGYGADGMGPPSSAAGGGNAGNSGEGAGGGNGMTGTSGNAGKASDDHSSNAATGGLAQASRISHSRFAEGGPVGGLHAAASLPPRFLRGKGDGQSDSIDVSMSDGGVGHLADNEFVVPADAVSALGSGSSEAGARALYAMVDRIRQTAHGSKQQAKPVDPSKVMPA